MTLIDQLIEQLDVTRQQAEGGVGLLIQHAQLRLSTEEFLRVADAIPAVSDLMGKAPRQAGPELGPLRAAWQRWFSGWGELTPLRSACEGLGLEFAAIDKFASVVGNHFRVESSAKVEALLLSVWR